MVKVLNPDETDRSNQYQSKYKQKYISSRFNCKCFCHV